MDASIEIDGLRKRFGPVQALDGMTFTVRPGQVTGFVGPNGAGKSTTMRVVVGLDAPDAGTATIGGRPYPSLPNPLRHVGSLLDAGALQPGRSGRNHLLWIARGMNQTGPEGMWDEEDGFYYDVLRLPDGTARRLKVRSMVGLLPICATTVIEPWQRERVTSSPAAATISVRTFSA